MIRYGIVVHGGVGSPLRFSDGCKKACSSAFELLKKGSGALEAVVEAARLLEDDGRFNAGSGSTLRLDGKTVEMDAGLMDSEEHLGIVISVRNVQNPILLAKAMMETPHVALAGQGAELFARRRGLKPFGKPSKHSRQRYRSLARTVYDFIADGEQAREACIKGIRPFPGSTATGIIAISKTGCAIVSNRPMAHYALTKER